MCGNGAGSAHIFPWKQVPRPRVSEKTRNSTEISVERDDDPCKLTPESHIHLMKVKCQHQHRSHSAGSQGFTLLEMVIVLGIIGLILGAAIGLSGGFTGFGREVQTKAKLEKIKAALTIYRHRAGHYPSESQGVKALAERPTSAPEPRSWKEQFKMSELKDGWDREFTYKYPGTKNTNEPEVISAGEDGEFGTDHDLSSQIE